MYRAPRRSTIAVLLTMDFGRSAAACERCSCQKCSLVEKRTARDDGRRPGYVRPREWRPEPSQQVEPEVCHSSARGASTKAGVFIARPSLGPARRSAERARRRSSGRWRGCPVCAAGPGHRHAPRCTGTAQSLGTSRLTAVAASDSASPRAGTKPVDGAGARPRAKVRSAGWSSCGCFMGGGRRLTPVAQFESCVRSCRQTSSLSTVSPTATLPLVVVQHDQAIALHHGTEHTRALVAGGSPAARRRWRC